MHEQISVYIEAFLSPYLCGFRKDFNIEYCLVVMLECWKKALYHGKVAGALLTDLSKAFDCINHELLIAKLHAYGFSRESLKYIYSYLTNRKHHTKVNGSFSSLREMSFGVPQGSVQGRKCFKRFL